MPVIHLFTVHTAPVSAHDVPKVRLGDFFLEAPTTEAALERLAGHETVATAEEVWAAEYPGFLLTPRSQLSQLVERESHIHWARTQEPYVRLRVS